MHEDSRSNLLVKTFLIRLYFEKKIHLLIVFCMNFVISTLTIKTNLWWKLHHLFWQKNDMLCSGTTPSLWSPSLGTIWALSSSRPPSVQIIPQRSVKSWNVTYELLENFIFNVLKKMLFRKTFANWKWNKTKNT